LIAEHQAKYDALYDQCKAHFEANEKEKAAELAKQMNGHKMMIDGFKAMKK